MSVKKELYLAVKKRVLNNTAIEHFALYNSQFDNIEQEQLFPFPCMFIEFAEMNYETQAKGEQKGDTLLRLYIGSETLKTEDLDLFDLLEEIHLEVQGFSNSITVRGATEYEEKEDVFSPLNRISESQDVNHDNIRVWVAEYGTTIHDTGAHIYNKLTKTNISSLEVSVSEDNYKPRLPHL